MRIVVNEDEFVWTDKEGRTRGAKILRAPEMCIFEPIELYRNGAAFDTAAILHIADAGYDGFEGFEALFGDLRRLRELTPQIFEPGDEIDINLLRGNIPEEAYWIGMTGADQEAAG